MDDDLTGEILEINHNSRKYIAAYVDMDQDLLLTLEDNVDSIISNGFASCVATAARSLCGNKLFLSHSSQLSLDINKHIKLIKNLKQELGPNPEITIAIDWHSNFTGLFSEYFAIHENKERIEYHEFGLMLTKFDGDYKKIDEIISHYCAQANKIHEFLSIQSITNKNSNVFYSNQLEEFEYFAATLSEWANILNKEFNINITNISDSVILIARSGEVLTDISNIQISNLLDALKQRDLTNFHQDPMSHELGILEEAPESNHLSSEASRSFSPSDFLNLEDDLPILPQK